MEVRHVDDAQAVDRERERLADERRSAGIEGIDPRELALCGSLHGHGHQQFLRAGNGPGRAAARGAAKVEAGNGWQSLRPGP